MNLWPASCDPPIISTGIVRKGGTVRFLRGVIRGGGIGAFFFFSWVIELLWNSILVDQLALVPTKVNYWQAAAVWFLSIILFAWAGVGVTPTVRHWWRHD